MLQLWCMHAGAISRAIRTTPVLACACRNKNLGDGIDYGQQQYDCLSELISDTLTLFEQRGGEDAYINIKYMVPTYESSVNFC